MNKRVIIFSVIVCLAVLQIWGDREKSRPPGIVVTQVPNQKLLSPEVKSFLHKKVIIKPRADYEIRARVLSAEVYRFGQAAKVVPIDLAVGWQEMSDSTVIKKLKISQSGRFYYYSWADTPPIDAMTIQKSSVNMHLVPATSEIERQIKKLRKGHIVNLKGQLVDLYFSDGAEIKTSLTRDDTGAGACEIMWVTSMYSED
jgi:hypothetical protein